MTTRTAFVTGGTGGIGSAICKELIQKGCKVIAGYYPAEEEQAQAWRQRRQDEGADIAVIGGDVSSFSSCEEMAKEVGDIDILVNCAGITRDKTIKKMTEDQWQAVLRTNLDSMFNVSKQFVEGMTERGFGRIINISSVNGQKGQFGQTNYSAAKAGVHGFTMALAQETARKGVTVNTVAPGYTATPLVTEVMPQDILDAIIKSVPMGRMATPEEIGYTVGFLADDRAAYITGAIVPVNGGLFMSF